MATKDTLIEVPLLASLDQGKDQPSIVAPGLLRLENGLLDKMGGISHRKGAEVTNSLALTRNHNARWVAEYDGKPLLGTTQGVYTFPAAGSRTNVDCSTYDAIVDHQTLSGVPNNAIEIDSFSDDAYTFVAFTIDNTYGPDPVSGDVIWYTAYSTLTGEMVIAPRIIAGGSAMTRPRVVYNGVAVSFWWIENGTTVKYTNGHTVGYLLSQNINHIFTVNSPGSGTDVTWTRRSGGTDVVVFTVDGTTVDVFTATGSFVAWAAGTSGTFSFNALRVCCVELSPATISVCVYETTSAVSIVDSGLFSIRNYNATGDSWIVGEQGSYLYASPNDPSIEYTINFASYLREITRAVLGLVEDAAGDTRIALWGSTFYRNNTAIDFDDMGFGTGCCTTFASVPANLNTQEGWTLYSPMFTYAIATHTFTVANRVNWAVGLVRSGICLSRDRGSSTLSVLEVAEDFASCIFVAPTEPPYHPTYNVFPISKAFDLRVPDSVRLSYNDPAIQDFNPPFSLARPIHITTIGTEPVLMFSRTRISTASPLVGGQGKQARGSLADFSFEVAKIQTYPYPQRRAKANGTSVGRGIVDYFDGAYACENAPLDIPLLEYNTATADNSNDSARVLYTWEDAKGNVHRSAPSLPCVIYKNDDDDEFIYVWDFPLTSASLDEQVLQPRYVEMYVDTNDVSQRGVGRVPYQRGVRVQGAPHIRKYDREWFGGLHINGGLLYTSGDVLENQAPPAFKDVCVAKGRVFGLTDTKLFYSKPLQERVAPEFNYALTLDIPDDTGATTAIMGMDDKLVVMCETGTYVLYGDGPNALGTGPTFAQLLRIPGNIGCAFPGSIAESPLGISFLSQQGIYLLDRGVNLSFIGKPVVDRTNLIIQSDTMSWGVLSTVHDIQGRHVRWIVETDFLGDWFNLVWYYETNQWGMFTSAGERQSVYINDQVASLISDSQKPYIITETDETGQYDGENFFLKIRTGWIRFNNIEGFQRAKNFGFSYRPGQDPAGGTWEGLDVACYSDYQESTVDSSHQWSAAEMTGIYTLSASQGRKDFSVSIKTQKTPAVSLEFTQTPYTIQTEKIGLGAILSGISVTVGAKRGTNKQNLAPSRSK